MMKNSVSSFVSKANFNNMIWDNHTFWSGLVAVLFSRPYKGSTLNQQRQHSYVRREYLVGFHSSRLSLKFLRKKPWFLGYSDQVFCILKDFKQRCWMFLVLSYCNSKTFLESSVYFKKKKKNSSCNTVFNQIASNHICSVGHLAFVLSA